MTDVTPSVDPSASSGDTPEAAAETPPSFEELEATYERLESDPSTPDASKAEIKKLRAEHKRYREAYDPYKTAFEGVPDGDRDAILGLANLLKTNPQAAYEWLDSNTKTMAKALGITVAEAAEIQEDLQEAKDADPDEVDFSDPAAVKAFIAEQVKEGISGETAAQKAEATAAQAKQDIEGKLKDLGYEDPSAPAAMTVVFMAKALGLPDPMEALSKAHEARMEGLEVEAQQYAAKKLAEAGTSVPTNGQATQAAVEPEDQSLTYAERRAKRIKSRLDSLGRDQQLV